MKIGAILLAIMLIMGVLTSFLLMRGVEPQMIEPQVSVWHNDSMGPVPSHHADDGMHAMHPDSSSSISLGNHSSATSHTAPIREEILPTMKSEVDLALGNGGVNTAIMHYASGRGLDIADTDWALGDILAERVSEYMWSRASSRIRNAQVSLTIDKESTTYRDPQTRQQVAKMYSVMRGRFAEKNISTMAFRGGTTNLPQLLLRAHDDPIFGWVYELEYKNHGSWYVVLDRNSKRVMTTRNDLHRGRTPIHLSLRTGVQLDRESGYADAMAHLSTRIGDIAVSRAIAHEYLDADEIPEFRQTMDKLFPKQTLANLGRRRMTPREKTLASDGAVYHQMDVDCAVSERDVMDVAKATRDQMRLVKTEPWLKLGLSIGAAILSILGWLHMDWWLKGRHAILSKVVFVMLAILSIILIQEWSLHA